MSNTAKKQIPIPYNFTPRSYQDPFFVAMNTGFKRAVLIWHRRAGKDVTALNYTIEQMLERVGTYYYFFPTYAQGKKVLWKGLRGDGFKFMDHFPDELVVDRNEADLSVELYNGSRFQIVGTDNYDAIMGTNPIGAVFSEYALQDPRAWDLIRPILRENGGWAVFEYTPRGDNHGKTLYDMAKNNPDWYCSLLTVDDTKRENGLPIISPQDIMAERAEGMDEETLQQEYYCSFVGSVQGSYFGKQIAEAEKDGRITSVPYDARIKVDTYWDLGMDDSMTIWFTQVVGREIRHIDYLEDSGEGFQYYAKLLSEKPYVYGEHYMPHDVSVRELGTGLSRKDAAENLGIKPVVMIPRVQHKEDSIQAARGIISRCYFDKDKCAEGLSALKNYQKEYDEKKKVFKKKPLHNWAAHGADAFQGFAMGYKEQTKPYKAPQRAQGQSNGWMEG